MRKDLNLYGGRIWPQAIAITLAMTLFSGYIAYSWMTTSTAVTVDHAVDLFRAEATAKKSHERGRGTGAIPPAKGRAAPATSSTRSHQPAAASSTNRPVAVASAPAQAAPARDGARPAQPQSHTAAPDPQRRFPQEGVYTWDTEGYEQAGGARRSFPEESQRIITLERGGWMSHHYFSEQREIWGHFRYVDGGLGMASQRNRVVFGPVTNDKTVTFAPPMIVAPQGPRVGMKWNGTWEGKTHGDYSGEMLGHGSMTIGGETVEVWEMEMNITLHGEQEGEVYAHVWYAPERGLTVREDYVQDVEADVSNYHAEWSMTLRSLHPRT